MFLDLILRILILLSLYLSHFMLMIMVYCILSKSGWSEAEEQSVSAE